MEEREKDKQKVSDALRNILDRRIGSWHDRVRMPNSNVPPSGPDRPTEGGDKADNAHERLPLDDARQRIERLLRLYYRAVFVNLATL